jgi:hypothetical protein
MRGRVLVVALAALVAGCALLARLPHPRQPPPPAPPTFSQYHLDGWQWSDRVSRVVVLPILNESPYTRAGDEVAAALTSELQKLGLFEVVQAPPDNHAVLAAVVHRGGRFDEAVMMEVGRFMKADVIVHGTITHYSPYPRPRLGLVLQAVGPREAKVVASVDGLWDATDLAVAWRCRTHYRQTPRERPPWLRNSVVAPDDSFAAELALESPALFQRFVCHEAALALLGFPVPGIATPGTGADPAANCPTPATGRK